MKAKRKDLILKFIVEDFIQTAQPVGSKSLLEKHKLDLCPATIRNVMAALEKEGLLEKTHTSSGRVPSTAGYRYYLEHISAASEPEKAETGFEKEFAIAFRSKTQSVEETVSQACRILSEVTSLATVVLGESGGEEQLVSVSFIPISEKAATVVLVTSMGHVENKTFTLPQGANLQAVSYGMKLLNDRLTGTKLKDLTARAKALEPILKTQVGRDFQIVVQAFVEACLSFAKKKVKSYGGNRLLQLPEFSDDDQFRKAVGSILGEGTPPPGEKVTAQVSPSTHVAIDKENDISIVTKRFSVPGLPATDISVLGPTRMDYRKVLDALSALAKVMFEFYGIPLPEDKSEGEDEKSGEKKTEKKKGGSA